MKKIEEFQLVGPFAKHVRQLKAGDHFVHIYEKIDTLIESVCEYMVPAFVQSEGVILVASATNKKAILTALERRSIDVTKAIVMGQLIVIDAHEMISQFMLNGTIDKLKFQTIAGNIISDLKIKFPIVRAYGEMVNILWHNGNIEATIELEKCWNELATTTDFSLFCGYEINEREKRLKMHNISDVCCHHTHIVTPGGDLLRVNQIVR